VKIGRNFDLLLNPRVPGSGTVGSIFSSGEGGGSSPGITGSISQKAYDYSKRRRASPKWQRIDSWDDSQNTDEKSRNHQEKDALKSVFIGKPSTSQGQIFSTVLSLGGIVESKVGISVGGPLRSSSAISVLPLGSNLWGVSRQRRKRLAIKGKKGLGRAKRHAGEREVGQRQEVGPKITTRKRQTNVHKKKQRLGRHTNPRRVHKSTC